METEGSEVQGHPQTHSKLAGSLGYVRTLSRKEKTKIKRTVFEEIIIGQYLWHPVLCTVTSVSPGNIPSPAGDPLLTGHPPSLDLLVLGVPHLALSQHVGPCVGSLEYF